jgi:hypothetical protein
MALTIIQQPPTRCFIGGDSQEGNYIPFEVSSNLFPVNTADTPRTILAKGVTSSGFFYIEVSSSFAAQFPVDSYVEILGMPARILAVSTPSNYRMVLNIADNGVVATSTTVINYYKDWRVELRVTFGADVRTYTLTTALNDISDILKIYAQNDFERVTGDNLTTDVALVDIAYREAFFGSSNSFTSLGTNYQITRGRTEAGQVVPTQGFFTTRPNYSRGYVGQVVPIALYGDGDFVQDVGGYELVTTLTSSTRQRLLTPELTLDNGAYNAFTFAGETKRIDILQPCLPFIEVHWRSKQGTWESHFLYVTDKRRAVQKDQQYISSALEAATTRGQQITAAGKRWYTSEPTDIWTLDTGKIGDTESMWLADIMQSDMVFYRNGSDYYPIIVLPSQSSLFAESQLGQMTFEIASAFTLQLQTPAVVPNPTPIESLWLEYLAYLDGEDAIYDEFALSCVRQEFEALYRSGLIHSASEIFRPFAWKVGEIFQLKGGVIDFDRNSVAYRQVSGVLVQMAADVARMQGSCPVMLGEPAATNVARHSEDAANAVYIKSGVTVTSNAGVAPDGTTTADLLTASTTTPDFYQDMTAVGTSRVYSVFVKRSNADEGANRFTVRNQTTVANLAALTLNFATGVLTQTVGTGAFVVPYANGWFRVVIPISSGITIGNTIRFRTGFTSATQTIGHACLWWGYESKENNSSYIRTTTTAASRLADIPSQTFSFGATSGAVAIELKSFAPAGVIAEFNDATSAVQFKININNQNEIQFLDASNAVIAAFEIDVTQKEPVMIAWNGASVSIYSSNENPTVTITPWAQITNFAFTGNFMGEITKLDKFTFAPTFAQFQNWYL